MHDEKPELPTEEEALAHYGVLGMKWGKSRAKADAGQVRSAQRSFDKKRTKYWDQQSAAKKHAKGTPERAQADKKSANMRVALLKDPDRVTAVRMTRGEKAAYLAMGLVVPPTLPVTALAIAGTSAASRRIEYKQDKGLYDKKK